MTFPKRLLIPAAVQTAIIAGIVAFQQILSHDTPANVAIGGDLMWMSIGMVAVLYGIVLLLASRYDHTKNRWAAILLLVLEAAIAFSGLPNALISLVNPIDFAILGIPVVAALYVATACIVQLQPKTKAKSSKRTRRGK